MEKLDKRNFNSINNIKIIKPTSPLMQRIPNKHESLDRIKMTENSASISQEEND